MAEIDFGQFHGTKLDCALQIMNSGSNIINMFGSSDATNRDFVGRSRSGDSLQHNEQYGADATTAQMYTYPMMFCGNPELNVSVFAACNADHRHGYYGHCSVIAR